ncbi:hypothetical protein LCGC14_1999040 [marine sediment metagenome]|uniref:Uncharacterized protein n=1 Tax=marine sediment metagenome TaxID=412755 RepID=A0A0F9I0V7_9ZZZZ
MAVKIPKSMLFRACIYLSPDVDGTFVAHCLELDLIGEGKTPKKAIVELLKVIETQIELCEKSSAQLFFPAPGSIWQKYMYAKKAGRKLPDELMQRIKGVDYGKIKSIPGRDYLYEFVTDQGTLTVNGVGLFYALQGAGVKEGHRVRVKYITKGTQGNPSRYDVLILNLHEFDKTGKKLPDVFKGSEPPIKSRPYVDPSEEDHEEEDNEEETPF